MKRLSQVAKIFFDGNSAAQTFVAESVQPQLAVLATPSRHVCSQTVTFAGRCSSPAKAGWARPWATCITAVLAARQGNKTLLLTTDPAAHLGGCVG